MVWKNVGGDDGWNNPFVAKCGGGIKASGTNNLERRFKCRLKWGGIYGQNSSQGGTAPPR